MFNRALGSGNMDVKDYEGNRHLNRTEIRE